MAERTERFSFDRGPARANLTRFRLCKPIAITKLYQAESTVLHQITDTVLHQITNNNTASFHSTAPNHKQHCTKSQTVLHQITSSAAPNHKPQYCTKSKKTVSHQIAINGAVPNLKKRCCTKSQITVLYQITNSHHHHQLNIHFLPT